MNETNCQKFLFQTLSLNKTNEGMEYTQKLHLKVGYFISSNIRHKSPNKCSTVYKSHIICQKRKKVFKIHPNMKNFMH